MFQIYSFPNLFTVRKKQQWRITWSEQISFMNLWLPKADRRQTWWCIHYKWGRRVKNAVAMWASGPGKTNGVMQWWCVCACTCACMCVCVSFFNFSLEESKYQSTLLFYSGGEVPNQPIRERKTREDKILTRVRRALAFNLRIRGKWQSFRMLFAKSEVLWEAGAMQNVSQGLWL